MKEAKMGDLEAPKHIGKYLVNEVIRQGSMGIVYGASDPDINRQVAIKTILPQLPGAEWSGRFRREAQASGCVNHPNLVSIFEYFEKDYVPYIVMERIHSFTLKDQLQQSDKLPWPVSLSIVSQILDGLACIHSAALVHRDVKPANVMQTETGLVKLADFSVARFTNIGSPSEGLVGTPAYMAPEQFLDSNVETSADIYATGVLLYELITGIKPFVGGTIEAQFLARKTETVIPPSHIVPGLSSDIDSLVLNSMCFHPAGRFGSAIEMREALANVLDAFKDDDLTIKH